MKSSRSSFDVEGYLKEDNYMALLPLLEQSLFSVRKAYPNVEDDQLIHQIEGQLTAE